MLKEYHKMTEEIKNLKIESSLAYLEKNVIKQIEVIIQKSQGQKIEE